MKPVDETELCRIICTSEDGSAVRRAKLYLWYAMENWPEKKLRQYVSNEHSVIRELAEWHLWRRTLDTSMESLLEVIQEADNEVKVYEAATLLGRKKCTDAIGALIALLANESPVIRDGAAAGLRELGLQEALHPLVAAIRRHPDNCDSFVFALQSLDCTSIAEFLVDLFISQPLAFFVRLCIYECFAGRQIGTLDAGTRFRCCRKIEMAIQESAVPEDIEQLQDLKGAIEMCCTK